MVIQIKIKPELIEWVCQQTGMDSAEAEEFVRHFAGMLYLTGAFESIENEPAPASSATVNLMSDLKEKNEQRPE